MALYMALVCLLPFSLLPACLLSFQSCLAALLKFSVQRCCKDVDVLSSSFFFFLPSSSFFLPAPPSSSSFSSVFTPSSSSSFFFLKMSVTARRHLVQLKQLLVAETCGRHTACSLACCFFLLQADFFPLYQNL